MKSLHEMSIEELVLAASSEGQHTERHELLGYDTERGWHSEMHRRQHAEAQKRKNAIFEEARRRDGQMPNWAQQTGVKS